MSKALTTSPAAPILILSRTPAPTRALCTNSRLSRIGIPMLLIWLAFALMLFVIEPLFLHRRMANPPDPARDFARMERLHWLLLAVSLITMLGAVAGSHGWSF